MSATGPTGDVIERLAGHVTSTRLESVPEAAVRAAKTFLLDSLGVGVSGSRGPWANELVTVHDGLDGAHHARVLGRAAVLSAPGAALCNAYQIHNAEFDCVHEAAVVHPMAALLGAALAAIDRLGAVEGRAVSGRELLAATILGVDTACHLGVATRAPMRFFRSATAGGFAATAAIGRLLGFDTERLVAAFGIAYGQMSGTMQAHVEGSPLLAMQVGFNARNAVLACEMARAGMSGPRAIIEGRFGYMAVFEGEHDLAGVREEIGRTWRITEVAHKPYPSGRATHGIIDACLELQRVHRFSTDAVEGIEAQVPPLTHRLVGRPVIAEMAPSYARLCGAYVAARALRDGTLGLEDFDDEALGDAATLGLARRIAVHADDNPDPNALTPITVTIRLADGAAHECTLDVVYGNPARPMSRDAHLAKFRRNLQASAEPLASASAGALIAIVDELENIEDVRASVIDRLVSTR